MAFPAGAVGAAARMVCDEGLHLRIRHLRLVTADAVVLDHLDGWLTGSDHLGLRPHGEDGGMVESVFGFEEILVGDVVVRNVAIVAAGDLAMGTVRPGDVLGSHQVAVDTGLGIVGEVGGGIGKVQQENPQPHDHCHDKGRSRPPLPRRNQAFRKKKTLESLG